MLEALTKITPFSLLIVEWVATVRIFSYNMLYKYILHLSRRSHQKL